MWECWSDKICENYRLIWKLCIVCEAVLKKAIPKMVLLYMITLIWEWNYGSQVLLRDVGITMPYNQVDLLNRHVLKYYHHAENYQQSILQDITHFGLRLKKKAAINPIPPDFNSQWNGILKDAEWKPLKLLLKEAQSISKSTNSEFQESIKKEQPNNYVKEKDLVEKKEFKI